MSSLFNRFVLFAFVFVFSSHFAIAEVCDKGDWDFERVPWFVTTATIALIFIIFVLPLMLAVAAIWRSLPNLSLALSGYALIYAGLFAQSWRDDSSQNISAFDEMVVEGCASYAFHPISVTIPTFLALGMFANYWRSRKPLYEGDQ